MPNLEEAKVLLEDGWKAREDLDFDTARSNLEEAQEVFESEGDYRLVTEALNHRAYTEKLDANQHAAKALDLAMQSEQVAMEHGVDPTLAYRAVMSTAETVGLYEVALRYANKMLPLLEKPILQGDLYSHIASFEMRTGNLEQARDTIEKALALIQEGWESEREPHRTIWKLRALSTQALITYNRGNHEGALEILHGAKEIVGERDDLKSRLQQIEMLISYLGD